MKVPDDDTVDAKAVELGLADDDGHVLPRHRARVIQTLITERTTVEAEGEIPLHVDVHVHVHLHEQGTAHD